MAVTATVTPPAAVEVAAIVAAAVAAAAARDALRLIPSPTPAPLRGGDHSKAEVSSPEERVRGVMVMEMLWGVEMERVAVVLSTLLVERGGTFSSEECR